MLSYRALFPVAALGRHRRRPSLLRSSPLRRSSLLGALSERSPSPLPTAFALWSFARRFPCRPPSFPRRREPLPLKRCASRISSGRQHRAFSSAPLLGRPPAVTCRSAKAHRVFSPPTVCHLCPRPNLVPGLQRFAAQQSTAPAAPSFLSPRTPVGGVGLPGATGRTSPW